LITLSPFWSLIAIFDLRFLINHNHVTLCRLTLIFRFLRVVWPELSDENLNNNFPRFYKISVLSRFGAIATNILFDFVIMIIFVFQQPFQKHNLIFSLDFVRQIILSITSGARQQAHFIWLRLLISSEYRLVKILWKTI